MISKYPKVIKLFEKSKYNTLNEKENILQRIKHVTPKENVYIIGILHLRRFETVCPVSNLRRFKYTKV
jgi:hypothetical protein